MFKYPNIIFLIFIPPAILFAILSNLFHYKLFYHLGFLSISLILLVNSVYGIVKKRIWARDPRRPGMLSVSRMYYGRGAVKVGIIGILVWFLLVLVYVWLIIL